MYIPGIKSVKNALRDYLDYLQIAVTASSPRMSEMLDVLGPTAPQQGIPEKLINFLSE